MPTPQLLDSHKYDDKSGTPSTGSDAELRAVVVDMLKAGHSDDEVRKFIQKVDDLKDPTGARIAGAMSGIGPGLLTGLVGVPLMVKDAVLDGISLLQGKDPENAKAFMDSVTTFLPKLKEAGPREQAKMVSELATSFGTGAAMGGGTFAARKPIAKAMGATLQEAATHPGAVRLASGGAMLHGFYNGSPTEMGMGLAGMSVPDAVGSIGEKLYKYGADGAKYVTKKERAAAQSAVDAQLPSGARSIDTGPVNALSLAPPTSGPQGTSRVPQTGMPATANNRVQRTMADEARSESAVAGRQAARAKSTESTIPVPDGLSDTEATTFREVKASNPQIPDRVIVQSIKGTSAQPIASAAPAGRPAIRVAEPTPATTAPVERRKVVGSKAPKLQETAEGTDSLEELMSAMHGEDAVLPGNGGGTAVAERPVVAPAKRVPANYMTDTDVANIGEHAAELGHKTLNTLEAAGADVPADGLRSTQDIDRVVKPAGSLMDSPAYKELQESIRKANTPTPTPSNLHMGSDASPNDMMADIRVRAQGGGGIRIDGSRPGQPISLVKGEPLPLPEDAAAVLKSYLAENPDIDPAVAEQHVRDFMAKMGTDE
jgi:hypothetical protein